MEHPALFFQPNIMKLFIKYIRIGNFIKIKNFLLKELPMVLYISGIIFFIVIISVFTPVKFFFADILVYVEWCIDAVFKMM
jgi:hypothetical protein